MSRRPVAEADELQAAVTAIREDIVAATRRGLAPRELELINEVCDASLRLLQIARFRLRELLDPPPRRGRTR